MQTGQGRARNPRGEGARLRDEIIHGAAALLDEGGGEESVTFRGVARRIGIAAPSIYRHFADRDQLMLAVVQNAFADLKSWLEQALDAAPPDPVTRLRAVCQAYMTFALQRPQLYRILFAGLWSAEKAQDNADIAADAAAIGQDVFEMYAHTLQDCVDTGASRSTAVHSDATALWVAMHGMAQLRPAAPMFPWPENLLDDLIRRLALLD